MHRGKTVLSDFSLTRRLEEKQLVKKKKRMKKKKDKQP